jgi:Mce-associated membrane protein
LTEQNSAGADGPGGHGRPRMGLHARKLRVVTAVLALVLVVAVVASVVFAQKARSDDEAQKERAAASNVATQFALRMDAVDGTAFDKYTKGINELLTTKAKTKNKEVFSAMKQSYEAAKIKGTGKVLLSGVGDFDDDSATVLVVHDASVTTTQGDVEHHYRWAVDVVKVDGSWLVDDFDPVN